jgi:hypothetical protein
MMAKVKIRDMVVILPGITGSVLQKDGRDVWNISGRTILSALLSQGASLQDLALTGEDDPSVDDLGDGIKATRIMEDFHLIPGLTKVDGYTALRRLFTQEFDVVPGQVEAAAPANYFEFAYDWRRDNRYSAHKLQELVTTKLPQWREHSGADDAGVILVAHSMGGLVSRYYLEVLQGWRDCRALVTFGTPYRGSVNALAFLANGYKLFNLDLTELMRSFTAAYQLLPIYQLLKTDSGFQRVAETERVPNIERTRAEAALRFHREIENAVTENRRDAAYLTEGYQILPVVGTRQPTYQSATLARGRLTISQAAPDVVPDILADGDGTVPRVSAIPLELSNEYHDTFVAEQHASLQSNPAMLEQLLERVKMMQAPGLDLVFGIQPSPDLEGKAALGLDLDDLYLAGEPVEIRANLVNMPDDGGGLVARVAPTTPGGKTVTVALAEGEAQWTATLPDLAPGVYRLELATRQSGPDSPDPVHDIFEVAGPT